MQIINLHQNKILLVYTIEPSSDCNNDPLSKRERNNKWNFLSFWRAKPHIARSSPREDHHWALAACIWQVPPDWKWPANRPSHTWLHAIEEDLGPLSTHWKKTWLMASYSASGAMHHCHLRVLYTYVTYCVILHVVCSSTSRSFFACSSSELTLSRREWSLHTMNAQQSNSITISF